VFGAIGILAAYQFYTKVKVRGQRMKAWVPLGGGLALLGILGSGAHVDVTAHLFGFMAGLILGILYARFVEQRPARIYQIGSLLVVLSLLTMSWMMALGQG
jgi:membrane associated rhomboid family serine protease